MEAVEEILDLEELQEGIIDETLKEFMKKDEEAESLLKEKITELEKEEEKLNKKEEEVKKLEESNREKISSDASPEELIEIANKLKEAREELGELTNNISNLESEREELIETKEIIQKSKLEYIKSLNSTNSNYEEQLKKINEAIEVCDNPTLKQVLDDVRNQKDKELIELQEKRNNELKTVLNESEEEKEKKEEIEINPVEDSSSINIEVKDEPKVELDLTSSEIPNNFNVNNEGNLDSNIYNSENTPVVDVLTDDVVSNKVEPVQDENLINIDTILSNVDSNKEEIPEPIIAPDLNVINTESINLPENNMVDVNIESKVKVIFEKDVPETLIKDIYSSSKIMPVVYDYLDGKINKGGVN